MTRPAIIIGLGGTGQWVLTFLKKDLLEAGGGKMPDGVKLLCFDTTLKPMAGVGKAGENDKLSESEVKLGSVKLDQDTEFIPIGDNVLDMAEEIRDGQEGGIQNFPYIAPWFDAKDLLSRQGGNTFNLAYGAGQIRPFGRMAIFKDLSKGPESKIRGHLQRVLENLKLEVTEQRQLEIILVASFAGGTGAGMFIDMGILARQEAADMVEKNLCVRGFYMLPRVFGRQNKDMQARAFAAWRELDRFLMVGQKYGQRQMNYNRDLKVDLGRRIFDVCYLVDAVREGESSFENMPPQEGLFPMVSDVISAVLDEQVGQKYTEYITSNIAGKLDNLPFAPYHSAIGAYTIKVPVYFDLQVYSHKFALDVLDRLLRPIKDVEKKRITGVAGDVNGEKPNYTGKLAALEFLRTLSSADFGLTGTDIVTNTTFTHVIAEIAEKDQVNDEKLIQSVALMNLAAGQRVGDSNVYLRSLINVSDDEAGRNTKAEVEKEVTLLLTKEIPPSRVVKDMPGAAFSRIEKKTPVFYDEHYGKILSDGSEQRGKYGDALRKCQVYQLERFKSLLYLWMKATLNGTVEDVERAKGGKLGYVRDTLEAITGALGDYMEFFKNVRGVRTKKLASMKLNDVASNALAQYKRHKDDKCWLCAWDSFVHPRAHMTQISYLQAEQVRIDHRKYDILLNVLVETADAMKSIVGVALLDIENWIDYLATGDSEKQVTGLYQSVLSSLDLAEANHSLDKRLDKIQRILGERAYRSEPDKVNQILNRFVWDVSLSDGLPKVNLKLASLQGDGKVGYKGFRDKGEGTKDYNLQVLLSLGEALFADLPAQAPVAKLLMDTYPDGKALADEVVKRAEPVYEKGMHGHAPQLTSCYVRVDTTNMGDGKVEADEYFDKVVDQLNAKAPKATGSKYEHLSSDNKYRMTVMRTNDLMKSEGFNMWKICQDAYVEKAKSGIPVSRFQTFPAEKNAAYYEGEIYKDVQLQNNNQYRMLHPSVVALLENRESLEYFFLCWAYGFVVKEKLKGQEVYQLKLPKSRQPISLSLFSSSQTSISIPDILKVIDVFVNKGSAVDNEQVIIDMSAVDRAIEARVEEIGSDGVIERLQFQLENPAGLVQGELLEKVSAARSGKPQNEQPSVAVEYEDLAYLATVIYKDYIKRHGGEV